MVVTASAALMVKGKVADCVSTGEDESSNSNVTDALDAAVGVPEIEPVPASVRPAASAPLLIDHR